MQERRDRGVVHSVCSVSDGDGSGITRPGSTLNFEFHDPRVTEDVGERRQTVDDKGGSAIGFLSFPSNHRRTSSPF